MNKPSQDLLGLSLHPIDPIDGGGGEDSAAPIDATQEDSNKKPSATQTTAGQSTNVTDLTSTLLNRNPMADMSGSSLLNKSALGDVSVASNTSKGKNAL